MTAPAVQIDASCIAVRHHLSGTVQGVGMRPAMVRLATELQLTGNVRNSPDGVEIIVEGTAHQVERFAVLLPQRIPPGAVVEDARSALVASLSTDSFAIAPSTHANSAVNTVVPLDTGVCEHCLKDVSDQSNRRYGYPFASCADCGPRYSLTAAVPWDRADTSMATYHLCAKCRAEDVAAADRRFHAQTNACSTCGPQSQFRDLQTGEAIRGNAAISAAAAIIRAGRILGLKGIGGYQFVCDATSAVAVELLRHRKRRPRKPLAIMVQSLNDAERLTVLNAKARAELLSPVNPIVLVDVRDDSPLPIESIHPHLKQTGVMLPTTPLHLLLLNTVGRACVVTSGNLNGEPILYRDAEALEQIVDIADACLTHNRAILRPIDDSVVRIMSDRAVTLRCARGLAPKTLNIETQHSILAVGAHQKVAVAISNGRQAVLGPHIGDMDSIGSRKRFLEQAAAMKDLYRTHPEAIAHDLHPDLFTTRWAQERSVRTIAVQHHHAHIVSGMVEHRWLDREVLGIAFDGTGYGTDGTIWGGEILVCTASGFRRVARLRPFPLLGGDEAVRNPWRVALALIHDALGPTAALEYMQWKTSECPGNTTQQATEFSRLLVRDKSPAPFPLTSSAGRLFDGVASILFNIDHASYEGEPAMRFEAVCDESALGQYHFNIQLPEATDNELVEIDWRPVIRGILQDTRNQLPPATSSMKFTRSMASAAAVICRRFPELPVILSGGCFQNSLLTQQTRQMLEQQNQVVGCHERIPPNDGGLAAGQLAVAAAQLQKGSC